jgi:hypothetical protein
MVFVFDSFMNERLPVKQIEEAINNYLSVLPTAHIYNICRQRETRQILEYLVGTLETHQPEHHLLPELHHNLFYVAKWDGVTEEPTDVAFGLLIDKVKTDVHLLKENLLLTYHYNCD